MWTGIVKSVRYAVHAILFAQLIFSTRLNFVIVTIALNINY